MPMNFRLPASWIILLGAVVFGGLAVFAASSYITQTVQREKDRLNPNVEMANVVVAKTDLKRGDIVATENMAVRPIPKEFVPGTAVEPAGFDNVEGARLAVDMHRGEVLIRGTLEGADTSTFSTRVPDGARAITLTVDEVNSISGLLQPNDRVDLFFTAKPLKTARAASPNGPDQTRLLLQNVLILATGRQVRPTIANGAQTGVGRAFTTITIQAAPTDVQRLILAQKSGALTAVLRGNADTQPIVAAAMDASELFGATGLRPGQHARRVQETTEIIIGGRANGHGERELFLQALGLDRPAASGPAAAGPATPPIQPPQTNSNSDALRDFLKSNTVPAEAATMTR
jgi:pilus assembly protein CpaB